MFSVRASYCWKRYRLIFYLFSVPSFFGGEGDLHVVSRLTCYILCVGCMCSLSSKKHLLAHAFSVISSSSFCCR
ncbi:hypothetical protein ABB37_09763 [Leptomonas pyrrhocoris]|uniref:Uncharacterized protein n=1 Tax=Leptomonas pyrrhocoris TaxID=157538 RepID=A0A0N0DR52_LEPPY|nr:hypothetical protein ABB37_09763 [Leptomonas pyrrhocoris]KPA73631.1 hypothetical protein ABB37_09763 [Leptomonas pyrrhocoris]|eukprot:XP_015652070.1 hypothetical protein ABB37_09763 [Leptomonas pyrrhocoris]